jgi:predicted HicB family RNase H-like nuclease
MKPKETKKRYSIALTPSIKEMAADQAEKLNMSLSAYIEELLKQELIKHV